MKVKRIAIFITMCFSLLFVTLQESFSGQWTLVQGNTDIMDELCFSPTYLEGYFVVLFTFHLQGKWQGDFENINNVILNNSSWEDLALELSGECAWTTKELRGQLNFSIAKEGIHQIWARRICGNGTSISVVSDGLSRIDDLQDRGGNNAYLKLVEGKLKPGKYNVTYRCSIKHDKEVENLEPELKFILVNKEDLQRIRGLLEQKVNDKKTNLGYVITEDMTIYVP